MSAAGPAGAPNLAAELMALEAKAAAILRDLLAPLPREAAQGATRDAVITVRKAALARALAWQTQMMLFELNNGGDTCRP